MGVHMYLVREHMLLFSSFTDDSVQDVLLEPQDRQVVLLRCTGAAPQVKEVMQGLMKI